MTNQQTNQMTKQPTNHMSLYTFTALKNLRSGYVLNGHYQISPYPQKVEVGGATLFYSGSQTLEERINSTGTLGEDLQLQVCATAVINLLKMHFSLYYVLLVPCL